jgi:ankyrin repeat protein
MNISTAIKNRDVNAVRACVSKGAKLNDRDAKGRTLLHHAARGNSLEIVRLLVEAGAIGNVVDRDWNTPLDLATGLVAAWLKRHGGLSAKRDAA